MRHARPRNFFTILLRWVPEGVRVLLCHAVPSSKICQGSPIILACASHAWHQCLPVFVTPLSLKTCFAWKESPSRRRHSHCDFKIVAISDCCGFQPRTVSALLESATNAIASPGRRDALEMESDVR